MKHVFIKLVLFILMLILFQACEKDDAAIEGENSTEIQEVLSKTLNLEDIPNFEKVKKRIQKLDKDLNSDTNSLLKNLDSDEVQILTDDIIYMTYAETHTYTFKLLRTNPQYFIENIVLHYNVKTYSYDEYLVQYDVDEQEFLQISEGSSLSEDVDVLITELKDGTVNSLLGKSSCFMVCETVSVNCTAGGDHSLGDPDCCAITGECNSNQGASTFQSCGPICLDTGGPSPDNPRIDDGGGTGGGGSTPGDDNILTNPNPNTPCETGNGTIGLTGSDGCITTVDEIERSNLLTSIGGRLSITERNWVNNQAPLDQIIQINHFIDGLSWNETSEGKDFAVEVVNALIENPEADFDINNYPGKNDGMQFEWWLNDNFVDNNFSFDLDDEGLGDLTKEEKFLVIIFPAQALIIRSNKEPAETETVNRFGFNSRNDKSDAFRHAFFNAMNSNDAGDTVSRLFSTAHESEVPANLILEVQMDLHNNNVGHIIGDNASFFVSDNDLSNSVYSELLAGNLFYLSPLDDIIPPNFGINASTQLTPTNQ